MRLTIQLYTVRDQLAEDPQGTFRKLKAAGLDFVEGGGTYGAPTAAEGRKMLDDIGLSVSGSHVGIERLENELQAVIDEMHVLDCPFVIVPWIGPDRYANGWKAFGEILEPIGEKLAANKLTLCYHNHDFEYANGNGLEELFSVTDPRYVQAELDVMWVHKGGHDPVTEATRFKDRLPLLHLKDYVPGNDPQWVPAGQGVVDLAKVIEIGKEAGTKFGAVELDQSPNNDPMSAVAASVEYLRGQGLL